MSSYLDWQVGDRIVCVNDQCADDGRTAVVKRGRIYTIKDFVCNDAGVVLAEAALRGSYCGWHVWRFRKVQPRKADISIFRAMLSPKQVEPA